YLVLLENIRCDKDVQTAVKNLMRYNVSGILAMCGEATLKYFAPSVPTVFLYGFPSKRENAWYSNVYSDMYQAGRVVGELLLKTGRKQMTFLGRASELEDRYRGFYEVCSPHKDIGINWVAGLQNDTECGYALAKTLLNDFPKTDAIIAHNDSMALGALRRLWEAGISVPKRMMLLGFDNAYMGRYSTPSLTSVGPDIGELASQAIQAILKSIENPDFHCQIPVQCKVFLRESCRPMNQKSVGCNEARKNKE
ncbi:MAG: LacI family DNA-binding transcriptional regulator, partial [Victivallales bacterium]|nr:LacI family DNA-binding transcriptional regulator [Victivallales bacterium]